MSLRFVTAGESHGPGLTAIVEGLPAGLELRPEDIDRDLARRQLGHGRGGRMKIEKDRAEVTAGIRHGRTLGSPVAHVDREPRLPELGGADEPVAGGRGGGRGPPAAPRPRRPRRRSRSTATPTSATCSSARRARETAARVAAGALAKAFLRALGVEVRSHVTRIGIGDGARAARDAGARRTSRASTSRPCAASTPRRATRWWPRSTPPGRRTSRSAACSR